MELGKKPAFRLRIIEIATGKSKNITIYEGKKKSNLDLVMKRIIQAFKTEE